MFRRRRNVSRWKPHRTTVTAHLDTIWFVPHQITRCALTNQNIRNRKTVARTSSVPPQAECIEMETTSNLNHSASRVARTSSVPPQAECIEMDTKSKHSHSASRYYLARASPNHSMHFNKPEHPQSKNSCKDIEFSAEGGMYRDGNQIKPQSERISSCKDITVLNTAHLDTIWFVPHQITRCTLTNQNIRNPKTVARTSSVPPKAECIEMDTSSNLNHSASRYNLSRASPNHSMTFNKPELPPPKNSCKDIECSAAGGMYRDEYQIKPQSQRISSCKDIE